MTGTLTATPKRDEGDGPDRVVPLVVAGGDSIRVAYSTRSVELGTNGPYLNATM